jgi:Ion transport protein
VVVISLIELGFKKNGVYTTIRVIRIFRLAEHVPGLRNFAAGLGQALPAVANLMALMVLCGTACC